MTRGACLCGTVRYEFTAPFQPKLDRARFVEAACAARSRSSFAMRSGCITAIARVAAGGAAPRTTNLFTKPENFAFTRGGDLAAEYKVPEAIRFAVAFCTCCGGSVPRYSKELGLVTVPAGTLDTDSGHGIDGHIYVGSKAVWFDIADALPQHAEGVP